MSSQAAREVSAALQKEHGLAKQKAREGIADRESRKYKKAVGRDALRHVDLIVLIAATKFQLVPATHPSHRARKVVGILIVVARSGDGVAHRGITANLHEWWPNRRL